MATSKSTIDYLLDQLSGAGQVTARKMFGEYCLYSGGKPVALVCDDQLFLKPTEAGRALLATAIQGLPYPGAKPHLLITADLWEDREWLIRLIRTTELSLPSPRPKKAKG